VPNSEPGINATLENGTIINTYPTRTTDGLPGYSITTRDGTRTHHGSLTG